MPFTPAQHRLFEWVKHGGHRKGLSQADASRMASEGIKSDSAAKSKGQLEALKSMRK